MDYREKAKAYLNMKYGLEGVKGMTFKEAMTKYYDKNIAIKRGITGKVIHSLQETITVMDAIANDWLPVVEIVEPNDIILRKVKFFTEYDYDIKYANIHNEKSHKEGWLILEDNKITGMLSNTEMIAKIKDTVCVPIPETEAENLEAFVELIKNLF